MNIWYLSAYDQPNGQSSRTFDISRKLVRFGHQVTMFTNSYCHFTHIEKLKPNEKWRIEKIAGIKVVWMKTVSYTGNGWKRGANMLWNVGRAIQYANHFSENPDVVIGPSVPIGTGWAAYRIAKMKGASFIFEVRDIWPQALVDLGLLNKNSLVFSVLRLIEIFLYHKANYISAVLPYTFKHVKDSGADPNKVTWIPNGANLDNFENLPPYDGGNLPLTAMYVGGFSATHDVLTIIRAAKILKDNNINSYKFVIVGSGLQRQACQTETNALMLDNVEFRDPVKKIEIPSLQSKGDVLIASVKDTPVYQFGINSNKIYDYLASARPIIFSGNAPNDPIAQSGAGLSIPPENPKAMADALIKLSKMSQAQRIELGNLGRQYVENEFDTRRLSERMEKLLHQSVRERGVRNAA